MGFDGQPREAVDQPESHVALLRSCRADLLALRDARAGADGNLPLVQGSDQDRAFVDLLTHLLEVVSVLERLA